jgi:hypothetical protein
MIGDIFLRNDWKIMTKYIDEKDNEIERAVNGVTHSWLKDQLDRIDISIKESMGKFVDLQREISSKMDVRILNLLLL